MTRLFDLVRNENGASAAEFALVLPILLIALIGTIDVGLYAWNINQAEKATQTGARWAVATDMVASGLKTYSFAVSGGVPQGTVVDQTAFPGVTCQSNGTTASCTCASGGTCSFPLTADNAAFTRLVTRMAQIDGDITASNVVVTYAWSGLGFSGDPNGPDVAPLTTVSLRNMTYTPLTTLLFQVSVPLPSFAYALTMEDGSGTVSN
ncbi:TadE/TadG family type IV pilus assembly protein [Novosphingobium pentaromativorans]|uniref:TadE-like protein n=1 Tax=Novosphingobium pentaromativorans US6-1 TaxID=1088721 RepID=G6EIU1_9SPHN|nr:TadE/TadG family type IV pilus assembly protein [Novosphingobium pentaromativorans]AIT78904.1 pilus assembly protein TadE [Novosphingobium pentaromativorans US6-1]EHJ58700.1 TadE-like protein [Novosphingobium pentaromativorans US6-1]